MASMNSSAKIGAASKKIESPLAKYNSAGQLMCVVCNVVVKSEKVWTAHINGRQHREQVVALKKAKETSHVNTARDPHALKRKSEAEAPAYPEATPSPNKKGIPNDFFDKKPLPIQSSGKKVIKSILKNSSRPRDIPEDNTMEVDEIPTPGYDSVKSSEKPLEGTQTEIVNDAASAIPEGFFDDPKLDAKIRHKEYKDPVEEEWNRFQKEINDEVTTSASIQEEDQEEATAERQLEEIEEQLQKWGKVLELEQRKEACAKKLQVLREAPRSLKDESSSDEEEESNDLNGLFNWRSKGT